MLKPVVILSFLLVTSIAIALPRQESVAYVPPPLAITHAPLLAEEPTGAEPAATKPAPVAAPAAVRQTPAAIAHPTYPVRLRIPAINFTTRVVPVGTDHKGDMAVPSGATSDVGWYAGGTVPGEVGSAVIGAHVFAAFKDLHKLTPGNDIYVKAADGSERHFIVTEVKTHALAGMSADDLFNRSGGRYVHLITCAGEPTQGGSTYTHRLVVYATLVE